jgi:hypothetical protein
MKFEELNQNSEAVFTSAIDDYLHTQGFKRDQFRFEFEKYYYSEDKRSTRVTIDIKGIYIYRKHYGMYLSDDYIKLPEHKFESLNEFKIFINKVYEENFII